MASLERAVGREEEEKEGQEKEKEKECARFEKEEETEIDVAASGRIEHKKREKVEIVGKTRVECLSQTVRAARSRG